MHWAIVLQNFHGLILSVIGNHNIPITEEQTGIYNYLNFQDKLLKKIKRIIFIPSHTHLSMDNYKGCIEIDDKLSNIYINAASIRPTDILQDETIQSVKWKDGTLLDIKLNNNMEIITKSIITSKKHPRGYYRFEF